MAIRGTNTLFWLLLALAGLLAATAISCRDVPVAVVQPRRVWEILPPEGAHQPLEPSGLALFQNRLLVVSDEKDIADIYELTPGKEQALQAEPFLSLSPVPGFSAEDLEGITSCGGRIYVVDEHTGTVGEVDAGGKVTAHLLDLSSLQTAAQASAPAEIPDAGMEGIACDAATGTLYVARERQPRMIYVVNLSDFKVLDAFDVPAGWESPRFDGGKRVYADYSDLYLESGLLYALQRSDRMILKIAPKQKRLVSKLRLDFQESHYYDYQEPFGMAEGLLLTGDRIYVVLDNNGVPRFGNPQNTAPLLIEFPRPSNF